MAIRSGSRVLAAEDLARNVACAAKGFAGLGLGPGDAVALLLRNDFAFFEASMAAQSIGAYATPINWHNTPEEVSYILADCGARALIIHADLLSPLRSVLPSGLLVFVVETPPEIATAYGIDPAICSIGPTGLAWNGWVSLHADGPPTPAVAPTSSMIYTSGTTGQPKGVRRAPSSDAQLAGRRASSAVAYGLAPGDGAKVLINGPMYHAAPNAYGLSACAMGLDILLQARFDAEETLALIAREQVTHLHAVPTMFVRLLKLPEDIKGKYDMSSLRFVTHGAAPCPIDVKRRMISWWGPVINEYYGSTETGLAVWHNSADALRKPGTVGKALPGCVVKVFDDAGTELPAAEIGDVYVGSPAMGDFTYHGRDDERREIGRGELVTVGDVGWIDEDGYLFLCDRRRDVIISGGVNIYPAEIESILVGLEGVRDCAVFGIPDEDLGETVCAVVELDGAAEVGERDVRAHLGAILARYKLPRVIEFARDLPREDSGKIFKRKLRAPYWAGLSRAI